MDKEYFQQLENEINIKLQNHLNVDESTAKKVINLVSTFCICRNTALSHLANRDL